MSFGWSVGDIALAVKAIVKVGKAVRESGGAASEYQDAVSFLTSIEKTLRGLETLLRENPNLKWEAELVEQGNNLRDAVTKFKDKIEKYEQSLGEDTERKKARRVPREIQFAVFVSDQVKELRVQVMQPQVILDNFIALQMLNSILDLSRDFSLSQENFEAWTERISSVISSLQGSLEDRHEETISHVKGMRVEQQELVERFRESLKDVYAQLRDLGATQQLSVTQESARTSELLISQLEIRRSIQVLHDSTQALLDKKHDQNSERKLDRVGPSSWYVALSAFQVMGSGVASGLGALAAVSSQAASRIQEQQIAVPGSGYREPKDRTSNNRYEGVWENALLAAQNESLKTDDESLSSSSKSLSAEGSSGAEIGRVFDREKATVSHAEKALWQQKNDANSVIDSRYIIIEKEARDQFFCPGRVIQTQTNHLRLFFYGNALVPPRGLVIVSPGNSRGYWKCLAIRDWKGRKSLEGAAIYTSTSPTQPRTDENSRVPPVKIIIQENSAYQLSATCRVDFIAKYDVSDAAPVMDIGFVENWEHSRLRDMYMRRINSRPGIGAKLCRRRW